MLNACKIINNLAEITHDINAFRDIAMSLIPSYPSLLSRADMAKLRFTLDFLSPCRFSPYSLLNLRQRLLACGREFPGTQTEGLFSPALSDDPAALRRFQKPSPAFVLRPPPAGRLVWQEGDTLDLDVLFLGGGLQQIPFFLSLLRALGNCGLLAGDEGRFEVAAIACQAATGSWRALSPGRHAASLSPDVISLGMYLDEQLPLSLPVLLEVTTPARLVAAGRVLRRPRFVQLFPFMLRRVTSMLYYHCHLEPVDDPGSLLAAANQVEAVWQATSWHDWRELGEGGAVGKVGGLTGELRLDGAGLEELSWIILLAALFGIGRGAAFGSGQLRLTC